jgi:hypothetical protein
MYYELLHITDFVVFPRLFSLSLLICLSTAPMSDASAVPKISNKLEGLFMREVSNKNIQVIKAWKASSHPAIIQHLATANQTLSTLQEWRS